MTSEPNEFVEFILNGEILLFWRSHHFYDKYE